MWAARAILQAESDQEPPGAWLPLCRQGCKWPDLGQGSCPLQLWSHPLLWHFRLLPLLLLKYVLMSSRLWFLLFCSSNSASLGQKPTLKPPGWGPPQDGWGRSDPLAYLIPASAMRGPGCPSTFKFLFILPMEGMSVDNFCHPWRLVSAHVNSPCMSWVRSLTYAVTSDAWASFS